MKTMLHPGKMWNSSHHTGCKELGRSQNRDIFLGYGTNQEQRPGSVQGQVPPGSVEVSGLE